VTSHNLLKCFFKDSKLHYFMLNISLA